MKFIRLLVFLTVFVSTSLAHAQSSVGVITGYVTDPSNSAVTDAKVTVIDEKTGRERQAITNETGSFTVVQLSPSIYTIDISQPGFATVQAKGIVLQVGQEINQNFVLHVQSEQTTVSVEANSVNLDTANAAIGGIVPSREITELPINGRQISQLYLLVPGATNSGSGTFGDIRFSGRAVEQNIIRLDGIESTSIIDTSPGNLNGELGSLFRLQQSLEAVQEFRIDSSSYPAEMGTGTGGQISFITKSGGNTFHGSAFEYIRNDFFDARNSLQCQGRWKSQVPPQSVRRLLRRSHYEGQALLLRYLRRSASKLGCTIYAGDPQQLHQVTHPYLKRRLSASRSLPV